MLSTIIKSDCHETWLVDVYRQSPGSGFSEFRFSAVVVVLVLIKGFPSTVCSQTGAVFHLHQVCDRYVIQHDQFLQLVTRCL